MPVDTTIPVMLDPELASDMVKLLGEELKRMRVKMRALEEVCRSLSHPVPLGWLTCTP